MRFSGTVGLCLRQHDGVLTAEIPRLRYSATGRTPVSVVVRIDGRVVARTEQGLAASPGAQTDMALPSTDVRLLRGERRAVVELDVGGTILSSTPLWLQG
jgi:hexokinase